MFAAAIAASAQPNLMQLGSVPTLIKLAAVAGHLVSEA